jgi:hypothetical protein
MSNSERPVVVGGGLDVGRLPHVAERVFLHVGPPKTGTTYLQEMLWRHRERLEDAGITLPLKSRRAQFRAAAALCDDRYADVPGAHNGN